jgi:surface-anchored protein
MKLLTRTRTTAVAVAGVAALVGGLVVPTTAHAAEPLAVLDDPVLLATGHIDAFNPVLDEDGSLRLALKEDVTGSHVLHTPESVDLVVKNAALRTVPENFLPGMPSEIYHLPLTQDHNLIWPGWDTQSITSAFPGADTDIVVSEVEGPGKVFLWSQGNFGAPKSLMKDGTGYELPNTISQPYPAHTHANWAFTAPGTYELTVRADATGTNGATGQSQTATYSFVVDPEVSITGVKAHYHQNTPIVLNAAVDPSVEGGSYEWYVQRKDQSEPVKVEGQNGTQLAITAEQALDEAEVTARLLADGLGENKPLVAESAPVTIDIDDHGAAPIQQVTVSGAADHYHTGDTAELTASVAPASVLSRYDWFLQRQGEDHWTEIEGEHGAGYSFEVTEDLAHAKVKAVLSYDDGTAYVESEPIEIHIDDHGHGPVETALSISGLAASYQPGDTAKLQANQDPQTDEDHYHWFIKKSDAADFSVISGALSDVLEYQVAEADNGAQVIARLYDHDHEVVAESAPVQLTVKAADKPTDPKPVDPKPTVSFTDVKKGDKFYTEIAWMASEGISTGVKQANGTFQYQPKNNVTREAMAAFLYRQYGDKNFKAPVKSLFTDVKPGDKFYREIAWMASEGISTGVKQANGTVKFQPKSGITREAMAAFMYRIDEGKKPAVPAVSPFADVQKGDKFYREIAWMSQSGLSTGIKQPSGKPVYAAKSNVTREAMAAFLYRAAK